MLLSGIGIFRGVPWQALPATMAVMKIPLHLVLLGSALMLLQPLQAVEQTESTGTAAAKELPPPAPGRFQPTDESLRQYRYPDWFRDAKLGFWSHWGPQAVPRHGDWYARRLYMDEIGRAHV